MTDSAPHDRARPVAVIVGASTGIGRATAARLAHDGWDLVLAARSPQPLTEAADECRSAGATVLTVPTDVSDADAVTDLFTAATGRFGRLDAVVHTAAAVGYGRFTDVPADVFERAITTNLLGTARVARAALTHFEDHGRGRLVVIGSLLGKIVVPTMGTYVVGKWGVHALVRTLQIEYRDRAGIEISLLSPGSVNTPAYTQAANYVGWEGRPPPPIAQPEKAAAAIAGLLRRPRRDRPVNLTNHLAVLGFRVLPGLFDRLVGPLARYGTTSRRTVPPSAGSVLAPNPDGNATRSRWTPTAWFR